MIEVVLVVLRKWKGYHEMVVEVESQNGKIADAIPVETHVRNDIVSPEPQKSGKESVSVFVDSEFNIDSQNGKTADAFQVETHVQKDRNMLDLNKLRDMQNSFIEDYFEVLNQNRVEKKDEMASFVEDVNPSEVHTFQEFVGFLNLIKNDDVVSKSWDSYRDRFIKVLKWFYTHYLQKQLPGPIPPIIHGIPIHLFDLYKLTECMGGYLSVHVGQEFGAIAEILGLTRNEGDDVKKCYMVYLDVFVSYYKTARAPVKGKEKVEHFDIKLEDEPDFIQQIVQHEEGRVTCYRCHSLGHYAYQCPNKPKNKMYFQSYKDSSSSKHTGDSSKKSSSEDLNIII
nr:ARID DNA-binding domain-containing protein [Tanacetum cinerariifolium]